MARRIKRKAALIVFCAIVLCGFLFLGISIHRDYTVLRNSTIYADGPTGIGGQTPESVYAYERLQRNLFAAPIFKSLEQTATNEGKVYALKALYNLDFVYYQSRLYDKYIESRETARGMSGCLQYEIKLNELVQGMKR